MRRAILLAALAALISSCSLYDAAVGPGSPSSPSSDTYSLEGTVTPVAPDAEGDDYTLTRARVTPKESPPQGNSGNTQYQLTNVVVRPETQDTP